MRVIVDANIVFSGILNSNGRIGDLLINSKGLLDFIAPAFLRGEIRKHYSKLARISKMSIEDIDEAEFQVCKDITFISEEQIKASTWQAAFKLVVDVDPNDTHYIAYARHFRCKLWSGDKTLLKALTNKGFSSFISTAELFNWRNQREKR